MDEPWEHPDWYDLHDTTWTAGPEREPEHYRELMLALPPLDQQDHLIDVGAGTGKMASLIASSYPRLGRITLVEPNAVKLERAVARLGKSVPGARIEAMAGRLGASERRLSEVATVVTVGSVLMPSLEMGSGTLEKGIAWLRRSLQEILAMLKPGAWLYAAETLAPPWACGGVTDPVRRLHFLELVDQLQGAGFVPIECTYRFRDRIVIRAMRPSSGA
jgi:hypothetical protein